MEKLIAAKAAYQAALLEVCVSLVDKKLSIDERWDKLNQLYYNQLLDRAQAQCNSGFVEILRLSIYDDFFVSRYQTVDLLDIYESVLEMLGAGENNLTNMKIDVWREEVLKYAAKNGTTHFTYDW